MFVWLEAIATTRERTLLGATWFVTSHKLRKLFEAWTQCYLDVGGLREVKNLQKKGVPARQRDTHTERDIQRERHIHTQT